jgi:serine/threonine-protein kinase
MLAIGATLAVTSSLAHAEGPDSVSAQVLFDQAKKLMAAGKYADACPKLEESQRLDPGLGTLLNLGDCFEHEGKTATAWGKFVEAAAAAKAANQAAREHHARERASALFSRLSNIVINVASAEKSPGLEVKRDGALVGQAQWGTPMPADPGEHVVSAGAPARTAWETKIKVDAEGHTAVVAVPELAAAAAAVTTSQSGAAVARRASTGGAFAPENTTEDEGRGLGTQRTLALVAGGVGAAGIVVGSVFGLKSLGKRNKADEVCTPECLPDRDGLNLKAEALAAGNISTAGFIVGAAGVVLGLALWFTATPSPKGTTAAQIGVGAGSVVVKGSW